MWKILACLFAILLLIVIAVSGVKEQRLNAGLQEVQENEALQQEKISGLEQKLVELEKVWGELKASMKLNAVLESQSLDFEKRLEKSELLNQELTTKLTQRDAQVEELDEKIAVFKQEKIQDIML